MGADLPIQTFYVLIKLSGLDGPGAGGCGVGLAVARLAPRLLKED